MLAGARAEETDGNGLSCTSSLAAGDSRQSISADLFVPLVGREGYTTSRELLGKKIDKIMQAGYLAQ